MVTASACEIMLTEHGPLSIVIHIGIQGLAGYLIPVMLLLCGILLWFSPGQRPFYSLLTIVLSLGSWLTSNLGGFFLGMLLGLVGGTLAFAWTPDSDGEPPESPERAEWPRGYPQILQPSWVLEMLFSPSGVFPPIDSDGNRAERDLAAWTLAPRPLAARPPLPLRAELLAPEPIPPDPILSELSVQDPVVQDPVVQTPVVQNPVVQTPVVQTPVVQTPVVQEPADSAGASDCGDASAGDRAVQQD